MLYSKFFLILFSLYWIFQPPGEKRTILQCKIFLISQYLSLNDGREVLGPIILRRKLMWRHIQFIARCRTLLFKLFYVGRKSEKKGNDYFVLVHKLTKYSYEEIGFSPLRRIEGTIWRRIRGCKGVSGGRLRSSKFSQATRCI